MRRRLARWCRKTPMYSARCSVCRPIVVGGRQPECERVGAGGSARTCRCWCGCTAEATWAAPTRRRAPRRATGGGGPGRDRCAELPARRLGFLPAFAELGEGLEDAANVGILDLITGWSGCGRTCGLRWRPGLGHGVRRVGRGGGGRHAARDAAPARSVPPGDHAERHAERARTTDRRPTCRRASCTRAGSDAGHERDLLDWPAERVLDAQRAFTEVVAAEWSGFRCPTSR